MTFRRKAFFINGKRRDKYKVLRSHWWRNRGEMGHEAEYFGSAVGCRAETEAAVCVLENACNSVSPAYLSQRKPCFLTRDCVLPRIKA